MHHFGVPPAHPKRVSHTTYVPAPLRPVRTEMWFWSGANQVAFAGVTVVQGTVSAIALTRC
eukprot:m.1645804 g.1645804  ORF g.1645804 m.1645804 type:complete len:61 (-) comp68711_c0_seq1:131-313(-)